MSGQEITTQDGEIVESTTVSVAAEGSNLSLIVRAEIDAQIVTAKRFPRVLSRVISNITTLATLDEETASEMLYALVRKKKQKNKNAQAKDEENKPIEGPSIRLAEVAAQQWGNCRIEARVIDVNRTEKYVEAEGIFMDLETNMASKATVRRRISTSSGFLFSDDMINVTSNAACAIAKRNAILAGIPRGVYRQAYIEARKLVAGTAETLSSNREKAIKAFATFGVTPEQIFEVLGVEGERDIKTDHIATLRALFATLKSGEATVEETFGKAEPDHKAVTNPLDDKPSDDAAANGNEEAATAEKASSDAKEEQQGDAKDAEASVETAAAKTPEEIAAETDAAYARGEEAKAKGMPPKAMPSDFKKAGHEHQAEAWTAGYEGRDLREAGSEEE
ncbi:hypothetical protein I6H96_02750 [Brucella anthropi]|uniref:Uncharacterized protein n=1 Tax=Brucella anthropi (strain ATCC 49188 / DSM 6882 / CCUG 24695 / JCM 21032 / LMG 3331 / NBRC 15819 / NCTC 12168 / Alc 37) TaxID=439375 RepID=A6WZ65_BRUA4|nr:hypothetical protein [Brucella anthropi]ABS14269.1 hypothetical protein Oant_1553 [Brucella anthropi ATCC 49188]QQC25800.1 hypothetical protein I6H96_02750 [Brucella anthropi]SUA65382.1 Uncharacterised protein [Brucella anthropi]